MTFEKNESQKVNIKRALLGKKVQIAVFSNIPEELFRQVVAENPTIGATISHVSFKKLLVGGIFTVKYIQTSSSATPARRSPAGTARTGPGGFGERRGLSGSATRPGSAGLASGADTPSDGSGEIQRVNTPEEVEEVMHACIRKYQPSVMLSIDVRIDIREVYDNFVDRYQGFYSNLVSIEYAEQRTYGVRYKTAKLTFNYRIGRVKLTMMETEVNKKIEELSGTLFCGGMSAHVKAFIAHNYLAKTVRYWRDDGAKPLEKSYMQSAYGALIKNRCVCQGYAEAYKRILDSQGIICEVLCGEVKSAKELHAWNAVSFNGRDYFHVDVTWDAPGYGEDRYKYYGLRDEDFSGDRDWPASAKIVCNGRDSILEIARRELAHSGGTYIARGADSEYFK